MTEKFNEDRRRNKTNKRNNKSEKTISEITEKATQNMFKMHLIKGAPDSVAKLEWDTDAQSFEAEVLTMSNAIAYVTAVKPPKIVPVRGDKTKVMRCDWSIIDNQYICDILDANDPKAQI